MLRRALALLQSPPAYLAAAGFVGVLTTAFAIVFGYLSPDSWFYIMIAEGLRHGRGCAMHGAYLGVYPCGYPMALALTAPAADHSTFMVSSKITNLLLLTGSFVFTWKASRNILVASVVALNPITLLIAMYTWSENLELFCTCGVFYALAQLNEERHPWRDHVLLGLFLTIGCFTRYFFGPFAFLLFVATWLTHGRRLALRALPAFAAAGVAYLGYQGFNLLMTGYPTGMPRVPAPETPYYLVKTFIAAFAHDAFNALIALALLLGLAWPLTFYTRVKAEPARHAAALLILYAGIAFVGLAFILRARTLFDPFDTRTTGFGIVFILAGLVGRFVRLKYDSRWPAWAVLASGLFSAFYADDSSIPDALPTLTNGHWAFAAAHVPDLLYHGPKTDVMVTFDIPPVPDRFWNVERVKQVYYGDITLISPALAPDITPDTPKTFLAKLDIVGKRSCHFDFTPYATRDDFQTYLGSTTPVDESFTVGGTPKITYRPNWDPALQRYLMAVVQPGKLVPCADILALPVTKAALAGQTETPEQAAQAEEVFLNH
jgi:hypothetical protein